MAVGILQQRAQFLVHNEQSLALDPKATGYFQSLATDDVQKGIAQYHPISLAAMDVDTSSVAEVDIHSQAPLDMSISSATSTQSVSDDAYTNLIWSDGKLLEHIDNPVVWQSYQRYHAINEEKAAALLLENKRAAAIVQFYQQVLNYALDYHVRLQALKQFLQNDAQTVAVVLEHTQSLYAVLSMLNPHDKLSQELIEKMSSDESVLANFVNSFIVIEACTVYRNAENDSELQTQAISSMRQIINHSVTGRCFAKNLYEHAEHLPTSLASHHTLVRVLLRHPDPKLRPKKKTRLANRILKVLQYYVSGLVLAPASVRKLVKKENSAVVNAEIEAAHVAEKDRQLTDEYVANVQKNSVSLKQENTKLKEQVASLSVTKQRANRLLQSESALRREAQATVKEQSYRITKLTTKLDHQMTFMHDQIMELYAKYTAAILSYEFKLDELHANLRSERKEKNTNKHTIESLTKINIQQKTQIEELQQQQSDLESRYQQLFSANKSAAGVAEKAASDVASKQAELEQLQCFSNDVQAQLQLALDQYQALNTLLDEAKLEIKTKGDVISRLQASAQDKQQAYDAVVEEKQAALSIAQEAVVTLEEKESAFVQLQDQLQQLQSQLAVVEKEKSELIGLADEALNRLTAQSAKSDHLSSQLNEVVDAKGRVEKSLQDKESALAQIVADSDALKTAIAALQNRLDATQKENEQLQMGLAQEFAAGVQPQNWEDDPQLASEFADWFANDSLQQTTSTRVDVDDDSVSIGEEEITTFPASDSQEEAVTRFEEQVTQFSVGDSQEEEITRFANEESIEEALTQFVIDNTKEEEITQIDETAEPEEEQITRDSALDDEEEQVPLDAGPKPNKTGDTELEEQLSEEQVTVFGDQQSEVAAEQDVTADVTDVSEQISNVDITNLSQQQLEVMAAVVVTSALMAQPNASASSLQQSGLFAAKGSGSPCRLAMDESLLEGDDDAPMTGVTA